jgi:hypothetical protein
MTSPSPYEPELPLFRPLPDDPNIQWLLDTLDRARSWMTAAALRQASGDRLDDRHIRALAAAAAPNLVSGQRGYRHIRHATTEEINRAADWLESQAREMLKRSQSLRRRHHQLAG